MDEADPFEQVEVCTAHRWVTATVADLTVTDVGCHVDFEELQFGDDPEGDGLLVPVFGVLVAVRRCWFRDRRITVLPHGGGDVVVHHLGRRTPVAVWR